MGYSKFTIPSSLLTLGLNQFDKVVFPRLFDLRLPGISGLAGNIAGSIEALTSNISQTVLHPRVAHKFRENPDTAVRRCYTENIRLFAGILGIPAAIAGTAQLIVASLYDPRYSEVGAVLQAPASRAVFLSFASPAEDLLISVGQSRLILMGNALRAASIVVGSLIGYYGFGFLGFVCSLTFSGIPTLFYYLWLQESRGLLIINYETDKVVFAVAVGFACYAAGTLFLALFAGFRFRF